MQVCKSKQELVISRRRSADEKEQYDLSRTRDDESSDAESGDEAQHCVAIAGEVIRCEAFSNNGAREIKAEPRKQRKRISVERPVKTAENRFTNDRHDARSRMPPCDQNPADRVTTNGNDQAMRGLHASDQPGPQYHA